MRTFTTSFIILIFINSYAQNFDGVWRVSHAQSIDSIADVDTNLSTAYTRFDNLNSILEINGLHATLHDFKSKAKKQKIKAYKDEFYIKSKRHKIKIESYSGDSLLIKSDSEPHSFVVLYPFTTIGEKLKLNDFTNSSWKLSSTNEYFNNVTFHFGDSGNVNTVTRGETYGSTNPGEWRIYNSDSFYCLYVSDRRYMDENIFYLTRREGNKLSMLVNYQDFLEHPEPIEVKLEPIVNPKETELEEISKNIIGKWEFESFIDRSHTIAFDSLISINYSMEFLPDHKYRLINEIKYIDSYSTEVAEFSHKEIGSWDLSNTGDYLTLTPKGKWGKNLTLHSLNSTTVQFDMSYWYNDHSTFDSRIKMVKENSP